MQKQVKSILPVDKKLLAILLSLDYLLLKEPPDRRNLFKSEVVEVIPLVCFNESAAVEFFGIQRWTDKPTCAQCGNCGGLQNGAQTGKPRKGAGLARMMRAATIYARYFAVLRRRCR